MLPPQLGLMLVRKHRAPKGALRRSDIGRGDGIDGAVRKYRAPKGALRHSKPRLDQVLCPVRKHRAPNGALRPDLRKLGRRVPASG